MTKWKDSIRLADEIIRPNPFLISETIADNSNIRFRKRYGENGDVISMTRRLLEADRGTLIAFLELTGETGKQLEFDLHEVARLKGVKNPYCESVLGPIRESIDRLLTAEIALNLRAPSREKKLRARFVFLEGWLDSKDHGNISISNYLQTMRDLSLGFTIVKPSLYFSLRGQIARALYVFLRSHKALNRTDGFYKCRLSKLCDYINYDPDGKPWSSVWQTLEPALKQLQNAGIIDKYSRDLKSLKSEGGIVTVYAVDRKLKPKERETPERIIDNEQKYEKLLNQIKNEFPEESSPMEFRLISMWITSYEHPPMPFL